MITAILKDQYLNRAREIQSKLSSVRDDGIDAFSGTYVTSQLQGKLKITVEECYSAVLNLAQSVYGEGSPQFQLVVEFHKSSLGVKDGTYLQWHYEKLRDSLVGFTNNLLGELESGFVPNVFRIATGNTLGELISLAKSVLEDGSKDVAAVLASAAYEDSLKQKAKELGLDIENKDVEAVINALKSQSFFKGPESRLVSTYIKLRNNAMHAEWSKFDNTTVGSLIGYVEQFLLKHFT